MSNLARFDESPVFAAISVNDRELLGRQAIRRDYGRDETVVLFGDVWAYLLFIEKGELQAFKESSDGRSLMVAEIKKGDVFWGVALFSENAPMPVTLETCSPSSLLLWRREDIMPVLVRNGQACWELCRLMAERMLKASLIVEELAFRTVAGRVARLLLEQAQDQDITPRVLTLEEMAMRIGSTREMVCRTMQRFASDGLIEITRTEFFIANRQGLEKVVEVGKG